MFYVSFISAILYLEWNPDEPEIFLSEDYFFACKFLALPENQKPGIVDSRKIGLPRVTNIRRWKENSSGSNICIGYVQPTVLLHIRSWKLPKSAMMKLGMMKHRHVPISLAKSRDRGRGVTKCTPWLHPISCPCWSCHLSFGSSFVLVQNLRMKEKNLRASSKSLSVKFDNL